MFKTHLYHPHPDFQDTIVGSVEYSDSISKKRYKELHQHVLREWITGKDYLIDGLVSRLMKNGEVTAIKIADELL